MTTERESLVREMTSLIDNEQHVEKLLLRGLSSLHDPRDVSYLWNLGVECRSHARLVRKHRRELDAKAPDVPYPRWPRGKGPAAAEALARGIRIVSTLARDYQWCESAAQDPYLRKCLGILADEHTAKAEELDRIFGAHVDALDPLVETSAAKL